MSAPPSATVRASAPSGNVAQPRYCPLPPPSTASNPSSAASCLTVPVTSNDGDAVTASSARRLSNDAA